MLRKFRLGRPSHGTVVAYLALFVALGGTGAYAANTVFSTDIVDGEVKSADVKDGSLTTFDVSTFLGADVVDETLTGADLKNGSLKDEDVAQGNFVGLVKSIGVVTAHHCRSIPLTGVNAFGDHVLLAADWETANLSLSYTGEYSSKRDNVFIQVCNPTDADVDDGTTGFNLLVFDAN